MVGGLGGDIWLGLRVDRGALIGDLSHVAVDMISSVLHGLDPAVGKGDGVRAGHNTVGIAGLSGVEVGLGVVVGNTVGVGVRLRGLLHVHDRGSVVGRGSVDNRGRGVVSRGGMDNRSRGIGRGSVHKRGSVVDGVGQDRGSVDSMVGNCVMGHGVSNNRGSMMHSMVSQRSSVDKRGSMVDGVRNNRGVGKSMVGDRGSVHQRGVVGDSVVGNRVGNGVVGDRVGDGVDCMVGRDNLAMSAVGHSGEASVGEVGAG